MRSRPSPLRRGTSSAVLLLGGGALAGAEWSSNGAPWGASIAAFYVVLAAVTYRWAGREGDVAAILRAEHDERQRSIDRDATAYMGLAVVLAALVGAVASTARSGDPGAYGIICLVGGVAYAVALVAVRRRR